MKLLGWMHRKLRQNSPEPFKELIIGNGCDEEHNYNYPKANFGNYKNVKKELIRKSMGGVEDEEYEEEDSAGGMYELFHGFLAIGTLGSEASRTPTFAISVENITEKEDEVTENELKLINDELEKVLGDDESSISSSSSCGGRNSHVSNGRSSHGSIITLNGGTESNGNAVCPLQGYLFGSAIELSETKTTLAKKENRTSLGELFQRTKLAEDNNFGTKDDKRITDSREADKSPMHLMKKKLKKKLRSSTSTTLDSASASQDKKHHKILHMFNRKVHPENSPGGQKCDKYQNNENKKKTINEGGHNKSDLVHPEEDIMIHPKRALSKENMQQQYKIQPNHSSENKEHWIKTDADYLVLEL